VKLMLILSLPVVASFCVPFISSKKGPMLRIWSLHGPHLANSYPDDRINLCLDVDMVIGCDVMSMIEMPDKHIVHRGAWCSDVF